jgi:magnesium-transporting ATPase (P-type)
MAASIESSTPYADDEGSVQLSAIREDIMGVFPNGASEAGNVVNESGDGERHAESEPKDERQFKGALNSNLAAVHELKEDDEQSPRPRRGLSTSEASRLLEKWGPNSIPITKKSKLRLFGEQFVGTMPYILEICAVISAAVQSWEDFAIIVAMLFVNACLGLREQLKANSELGNNLRIVYYMPIMIKSFINS